MSIKRLLASAALGAGLLLVVGAVPSTASAAPSTSAALPQVASTGAAADWLAGQFTPSGFIPTSPGSGVADLSTTANAVLALASARVDTPVATSGLNELAANVDSYVNDEGSDGAGQLSLLILDAHALGADPESFGGTDLVARLLATQQTTGVDAGLFGSQDPIFDGAYRQGLSLSALAAVGVTGTAQVTSAESWLDSQQCPDGGWTSYITADNPCNGDPADFVGPDTNSTSQAIQGLSAQGALTGHVSPEGAAVHQPGRRTPTAAGASSPMPPTPRASPIRTPPLWSSRRSWPSASPPRGRPSSREAPTRYPPCSPSSWARGRVAGPGPSSSPAAAIPTPWPPTRPFRPWPG